MADRTLSDTALSPDLPLLAGDEASAALSELGSFGAQGGGPSFCDDCGWQECAAAGQCIRPFMTLGDLFDWPMSQAELLQLADELASNPPAFVWIGYDPALSRDDHAVLALDLAATVCLTGGETRPVDGCNSPRDAVDGVDQVSEASASPVPTGTTC